MGGDAVLPASWDEKDLFDRFPNLRDAGIKLAVDVLEANDQYARLSLATPMVVGYEESSQAVGLSLLDMLSDQGSDGQLLAWMLRRGEIRTEDLARHLGIDKKDAEARLEVLVSRGRVVKLSAGPTVRYRAVLGWKRGRTMPEKVWQALGVSSEESGPNARDPGRQRCGVAGINEPEGTFTETFPKNTSVYLDRLAQAARGLATGSKGRFLLSLSPIIAVLLLAEIMIATGTGSFSAVLSFLGVVTVTIFAGIFPALMLVSSRRKGDIAPPKVYRFIGHPLLMGAIYLFFLLGIFIHGFVIWQGIIEKTAAILSRVVVLAATAAIVKRGAFKPRVVVELRQNHQEEGLDFTVVAAGEDASTDVSLHTTQGIERLHTATGKVADVKQLRRVAFKVPFGFAGEFKVWVHRITTEGQSESLPAHL